MSEEIKKKEENKEISEFKKKFWRHETIWNKKCKGEKNSGKIVVVREPNSGIKENIARMMTSGAFAHAALGTGLKEEQAKAMIFQARKIPQLAEAWEQQKDLKTMNEFLKMNEERINNESIMNEFLKMNEERINNESIQNKE